jgi:hypothetical protein
MAGEPRAVSHIRSIDTAAEPTAPSALAEAFYADALRELSKLGLPFLLAGTYAFSVYTGITRATKDLDILCKPSDYPRILQRFQEHRLRRRNRGRALDRKSLPRRALLRPDLRLLARHHAGERSMVRARAARGHIRRTGARDRAD